MDRRSSDRLASSSNATLAESLQQAGDLLEQQGANPYRVAAYRRAAGTVSALHREVAVILEQDGFDGLTALANIGRGIAAALREMVETGRWGQLERLRGATDPVVLFRSVPGLGPRLARKIHDALDIDSLEALEVAAHDGRLEAVPASRPRARRSAGGTTPRPRAARPETVSREPMAESRRGTPRTFQEKAS